MHDVLPAFSIDVGRGVPEASPAEIARLLAKYEEMRRLRLAHLAAAKAEPDEAEPDPRPAMIALAAEFPGALRELDRLPLGAIEARLAALAKARDDRRAVAPWMTAQSVHHRFARAALAAKRWLAGAKAITPEVRARFRRELADAAAVEDDLEALAAPPGGRVMGIVDARVARVLGVDPAQLGELFVPRR